MRIVAALAMLVKHLLPAPRQAAPPCIGGGPASRGWPSHRHRPLIGPYPGVTHSITLSTEVLRRCVWKVTIQFT